MASQAAFAYLDEDPGDDEDDSPESEDDRNQ